MVEVLVSRPPSQRWLTKGCPTGGLYEDLLRSVWCRRRDRAAGDSLLDEVGAVDVRQRLLQVDDVDAAAR